jgi:hypothetical protein
VFAADTAEEIAFAADKPEAKAGNALGGLKNPPVNGKVVQFCANAPDVSATDTKVIAAPAKAVFRLNRITRPATPPRPAIT